MEPPFRIELDIEESRDIINKKHSMMDLLAHTIVDTNNRNKVIFRVVMLDKIREATYMALYTKDFREQGPNHLPWHDQNPDRPIIWTRCKETMVKTFNWVEYGRPGDLKRKGPRAALRIDRPQEAPPQPGIERRPNQLRNPYGGGNMENLRPIGEDMVIALRAYRDAQPYEAAVMPRRNIMADPGEEARPVDPQDGRDDNA